MVVLLRLSWTEKETAELHVQCVAMAHDLAVQTYLNWEPVYYF